MSLLSFQTFLKHFRGRSGQEVKCLLSLVSQWLCLIHSVPRGRFSRGILDQVLRQNELKKQTFSSHLHHVGRGAFVWEGLLPHASGGGGQDSWVLRQLVTLCLHSWEAGRCVLVLRSLSSVQPWTSAHGPMMFTFRVCLPTAMKSIYKFPHRHTLRFVS